MLAVIAGFVVTTIPGVRAQPGYSWWMDGVLQNLAFGAAAALCLVRIPAGSPDRTAWRFIAAGILSFGLANTYFHWVAQHVDPLPIPSLSNVLGLAFYPCSYIGLVLLMRPRVARLPLGLWLDG
ncbi:MAG: hypothetical protein Q7U75_05495, partial [Desulfobacterales bacterium]|nr:hypothetical protein [Desulfobacterales bacterium]